MATSTRFIIFSALVFSVQTKTLNKDFNPTLTKDAVLVDLINNGHDQELSKARNSTHNKSLENNFRIIQVPKRYFEKAILIVEVYCANESVFAAEIVVSTLIQTNAIAYRKVIHCGPYSSDTFNIHLKLPRYIAYKPGHFNKYSIYVESAALRCWFLTRKSYINIKEKTQKDYFKSSNLSFESPMTIAEPYSRPIRPATKCYHWLSEQLSKLPYTPQCDQESEVIKSVTFPVVLSGFSTGIHRVYTPFKNANLRMYHSKSLRKPVFSFVMWLYMEDYCPSMELYCSILQHITWNDRFATPQISINKKGQVGVELIMETGIGVFHLSSTNQTIPKHTWSMLILACQPGQCNLSVSYGHPLKVQWVKELSINKSQILYFDDTTGMMIFGGSELSPSFKGYIGKATYYRTRAVLSTEAEKLTNEDTAMKLQLNKRHSRCMKFIEHIHQLMHRQRCIMTREFKKVTCPTEFKNPFYHMNGTPSSLPSSSSSSSPPSSSSSSSSSSSPSSSSSSSSEEDDCIYAVPPKLSHYKYVYELVKKYSYNGWFDDYEGIADEIHDYIEYLLYNQGVENMELITSLLKQSSCLGNHDATFMLSVVLNYGVKVKSVEVEPHSFLMYGAMEGNRLCLISLGNKHVYALDGFSHDYEQAYVYFKSVADMTNMDLRYHKANDVFTEMVRLTNDIEVSEHTDDDGDVIQYLKMQADQGVLLAQKRLARMYYWGSGGLTRNIEMAFRYYRLAADSGDASSLYDYGIVLLKGHGTEKNVPLAVKLLERSAALGHAQAMNSLGWYAMEVQKNNTRAAQYFHQSHDLGNKDASYNLAHMFLKGKYPNSTVDKVRAWDYIASGALRGQYEAGILVGKYNMRGHPKISRNPQLAVGWIRYVAEQNPGIGRLLHKGLKSYKDTNWFSALVYYLMSASTGVEVANFNLAYLCDEDKGGHVKLLEKECKWRHYNLSTLRSPRDVDPYALNKMAYYHYYHGKNGQQDREEAVRLYFNAAIKGDPQGLYNLAMLINEGVNIPDYILNNLLVPVEFHKEKYLLSAHLLLRCQDLRHPDAYIPCTYALYELIINHAWESIKLNCIYYQNLILVLGVLLSSLLASYYHLRRLTDTSL